MKKMISMLLALCLVFSLAVTAFADDAVITDDSIPTNGTITINGVSLDAEGNLNNTYEIYELLVLESYNVETGNYSYKVHSDWEGFFATEEAQKYMAVDGQKYATWIAAEDDDTVATFAKAALAYAQANGIDPVQSSSHEGEFEITGNVGKFENLELGYYLVDSSVGALCGLTTTNPNASINAKNGVPTIDKQVKEDSTGAFGDSNTADVGQTVEFRTTINVHAGAQNYVLHDKMSNGLTFQQVSKIEHIIPNVSTTDVPAENYTVVTEGLDDDCTFEVRFTQAFCDHLETNDKIVVYYEAMLNRYAIVAENGNPNEAWLDFGEGNHSTHDSTTTKTYGFDLVKTDSQNKLLAGAEFKIYDASTGGNEIAVVPLMEADNKTPIKDDDGVPMYRRARADETGVSIVVSTGKVRVVGFDNGTYYLEETVTPAGYNKLAERQKFIISDANLDATFNGDVFSTGSGVHVVNKSGTMLPETGAMGTTMFIFFGTFAVLATGVLLVTKKRMSMIED